VNPVLKTTRSLLAVVIGYAVMGFLITLVQESWFGGVSFSRSALAVLAISGFLTFLSAVAGGFLAAWIAGHHELWHAAAMCLLVSVEATWLITTGRTHDPLWFDTAAGSLLAGILIGCWLRTCPYPRPSSAARA
jgi:type II secretory pathway pseudopilin PulG